jgi:catechol 2,3-dioxygenase
MHAKVVRIGHIGIVVGDLDRAIDFYTGPIGLRLSERFEYPEEAVGHGVAVAAGAFVRCDATHHCISIFVLRDGGATIDGGAPEEPVAHGLHHVAFEMATPDELLAKYRELRDAGVEIVNCRRGGPGNQPRFYARDPDGHLLEFYWGIDTVGWDGRPREYAPIEEIDLEAFDFEGFVAGRERAAVAAREA